jgi:MutS domain V
VTDPAAAYALRLAELRAAEARLNRRLAWAGNGRFALLPVIALSAAVLAEWRVVSPYWLLVPVAAFAVLTVVFARSARQLATVRRAIAYCDLGLARLGGQWPGRGVAGAEYLDETHPCAADLDLFGRGSLFELLCTAQTRAGRDTLARWLLEPADPDEVRLRQGAVRELNGRPADRERLYLLGGGVPEGLDTAALAAWGAAGAGPPAPWAAWAAPGLVALTLAAAAGWALGLVTVSAPALALLAQTGFAAVLSGRVRRALDGLRGRSRDLFALAGLVGWVERGPFTAARWVALQDALKTDHVPPSRRLSDLASLVSQVDATKNQFFGLVAPFLLWTTRTALAVDDWRRAAGPALGRWVATAGEAEALAALATYAYENPADAYPELVPGGPLFEAAGLAHPFLPRDHAVPNDVALTDGLRLLVVSGSNMSGKSTLLRAAGVAAVLAQAGAPVRAARLRLSPLAVGATLRVLDSLQSGRSRFYAEITRLRQVVALCDGPRPVLFLLDEILHGTNSHDRRVGTAAVLRGLLHKPAVGLVTTHDLALTRIADELAPRAANVHFADEFVNGELHFDYRLRPGVVEHSNALALMRAVGLPVDDAAPARP